MFKYVKDFFKTLSMEIGGIKLRSIDLSVVVSTQDMEIEVESPKVSGVDKKPKILGEFFAREVNVRSADFKGNTARILVGNIKPESIDVKNPVESFKTKIFVENLESQVILRSENLQLENLKVSSENISIETKIRNGKDFPHIWRVSYKKSRFVEKEKILDALARLLKRYGGKPEKMEFLGYFRDIPIGMAEAMIVEKGKLVLSISRRKLRRSTVVDLVAIKTPKGVMVEVVR